jgi:hypothetical protein
MLSRNRPWNWTKEEDERLKAFVAQGASVVKVAAALKRKLSASECAPVRSAVHSRPCGLPARNGLIRRTTFRRRERGPCRRAVGRRCVKTGRGRATLERIHGTLKRNQPSL